MNNRNNIAAVLAIMAMTGFLSVIAFLGLGTVPTVNKDFFNTALIALISCVSTAFGYYLGSSLGSAQKNDIIAQAVTPDALPTTPPATPPFEKGGEGGFAALRLLPLLALAALLLMLCGCATGVKETPQSVATKSLLAMKEAIVATATVGDRLCKGGQLDAKTCQDLSSYYILAGPAYDVAANALSAAIAKDTAVTWSAYNKAVQDLGVLYLGITQIGTKKGLIKLAESQPNGGN